MSAVTVGRGPGIARLADLLALSEDDRRRFELIGGELVERGAATGRYGGAQGRTYHQHAVPHYWILDPAADTLLVYRWSADGYLEVLAAERGERVRAEPFEALELGVGVLFGDDEALQP